MQPRIKHPVALFPEALQAGLALAAPLKKCDVPPHALLFMQLRASQINGCGFCVDMHARELRQGGEREERIAAVGAWRDTPYFNDAERAALALTEAATRLADREEAVSDAVWNEAARHYGEKDLAALVLNIAIINFWNRLNATTHQVAGPLPK